MERIITYDHRKIIEQEMFNGSMVLTQVQYSDLSKLFHKNHVAPFLPKSIFIKDGSLTSVEEYRALALLCKLKQPDSIFEIGTFEGYTTKILSTNAPKAKVYTLDLPLKQLKTELPAGQLNAQYISKRKLPRFKRCIQQLYGDSAVFDFSPFKRKIDFIFVDGAHTYEYTKNDSEKAMEMASKDSIIVWHDYNPAFWPGTVKCLNELSQRMVLYHIKSTFLVFWKSE